MIREIDQRISGTLTSLCPVPAVAAVRTRDIDRAPYPIELSSLEGASVARVHEFVTTRACASDALRALGAAQIHVGRGENRAPIWPRGFRGSLTHCDHVRAALVVRAVAGVHIGIDVEPHRALPAAVRERILSPREDAPHPAGYFDVMTFSAKEAAFKAWSAASRGWLDFDDVAVAWQGSNFVVTPVIAVADSARVRGQAAVVGDYAITVAAI